MERRSVLWESNSRLYVSIRGFSKFAAPPREIPRSVIRFSHRVSEVCLGFCAFCENVAPMNQRRRGILWIAILTFLLLWAGLVDGCNLRWTFWQYSQTGPGKTFGVSSRGIDLNVFAGSAEELLALAGYPAAT